MSGGHYDYAFTRVEEMAQLMEGEAGEMFDFNLRLRTARFLGRVAALMRKIEWEDSGDGGDWQPLAERLMNGEWE